MLPQRSLKFLLSTNNITKNSYIFKSFCSQESLKKTKLHDFHESQNGKMVPFCGWSMPLQYNDLSIMDSHLYTRSHASIFDVSHMCQLKFTGENAEEFLEYVTVADLQPIKENNGTYSLMLNDNGGIIDDLIINKHKSDDFYVVVNAGCEKKDVNHFKNKIEEFIKTTNKSDVEMKKINNSLIALQGPKASDILSSLVSDKNLIDQQYFMNSNIMNVAGIDNCIVTRCGYTGEDGFEISIPDENDNTLAEGLVSDILKKGDVAMAGLAVRDTLRLEAGLCLYGNDLTEETTPISASLLWTISKPRRENGNFVGFDKFKQERTGKTTERKRVGFVVDTRRPLRQNVEIINPETKEVVGSITSGGFSPSLKKPIGMAYVDKKLAKVGNNLEAKVGKKTVPITISKMPFMNLNYKMK
eukprot:TRINITY_DN7045_c0_g1_i1.p1 TRINITY_DN7045_c0_g1~~TRINITY_DN7045_c0_g1_i1.p1  ORF type:complete len:414 (-),score=125.22 TRINITY_DN7045_c0_g1_i1:170-1411(-)